VTIGDRCMVPRQGNNSYIFPGLGLGVAAVGATRVTDEMFMASARALAAQTTQVDLDQGSLYPPLRNIRDVSVNIAAAVAAVAYDQGLARIAKPDDLPAFIKSRMWNPAYPTYATPDAIPLPRNSETPRNDERPS